MTQQNTAELEQSPALESWKQWEGQTVNGEFPLHRYLGGSAHSAVFLTEYGKETRQRAAIKLVPDEAGTVEAQLSQWALDRGLSHPNLLAIFQTGRCQIGDVRLLYVVMEYAEENLAQILPERALTAIEVRDMLGPLLDALNRLHGTGLVHGHLKPSNIMACGDQLKLSTDQLCRIGDPITSANPYDPPERKYSAAADSWALGMTLVKVLTQHLPPWDRSQAEEEPTVPQSLAEPFLGITRRCLRRNPALRLKVADIASRLEPVPAEELPRPVLSQPVIPPITAAPSPSSGSSHFPWKVVIGLTLAVIVAGSLLLKRRPHSSAPSLQPAEETTSQRPAPNPVPPAPQELPPASPSAIQPSGSPPVSALPNNAQANARVGKQEDKRVENQVNEAQLQKTPDASSSDASPKPTLKTPVPSKQEELAQASSSQEGIHQVLPDVPQKARNTIHGTLRLSVRVSVDPSGHVSSSSLETPGPSKYFADFALKAARQWTFPPVPGRSRDWILHFAFTSSDTRAVPTLVAP